MLFLWEGKNGYLFLQYRWFSKGGFCLNNQQFVFCSVQFGCVFFFLIETDCFGSLGCIGACRFAAVQKNDCMIEVIDHFTVVCSVTWPLDDSEARVDLVLIQTAFVM